MEISHYKDILKNGGIKFIIKFKSDVRITGMTHKRVLVCACVCDGIALNDAKNWIRGEPHQRNSVKSQDFTHEQSDRPRNWTENKTNHL